MQRILFLLLVLFFLSCDDEGTLKIDCLPADLETGVLAYYTFANGSLVDISGQGNDLSNIGGAVATADRNGSTDCAIFFDQTQGDQYLSTTASGFLDGLTDFSVAVWYAPADSTRDGGAFEVLVSRGDEGRCPNRRGEWSLGLYDCRRAVFGHNNSVWTDFQSSAGCTGEVEFLSGSWHQVIAVKQDSTFRIYYNSILQEEKTGNANCGTLHLAEDVGDFFVGSLFNGAIDDLLIYDRALSTQEITDLYALEPCCD